jgi:hypothetical protein
LFYIPLCFSQSFAFNWPSSVTWLEQHKKCNQTNVTFTRFKCPFGGYGEHKALHGKGKTITRKPFLLVCGFSLATAPD